MNYSQNVEADTFFLICEILILTVEQVSHRRCRGTHSVEHFLFSIPCVVPLQQSIVMPGHAALHCEVKYLLRFYCNWKLFYRVFFFCV